MELVMFDKVLRGCIWLTSVSMILEMYLSLFCWNLYWSELITFVGANAIVVSVSWCFYSNDCLKIFAEIVLEQRFFFSSLISIFIDQVTIVGCQCVVRGTTSCPFCEVSFDYCTNNLRTLPSVICSLENVMVIVT